MKTEIDISFDTLAIIRDHCGGKSLKQMIANLVWQASRDPILLSRARDMVDHQPWEEYDNKTYR